MLRFEWDVNKAHINKNKHGVSFEEAATVFGDPLSLTILDDAHSDQEERLVTLGRTSTDRMVVVVHLEIDEETIRLVSARPATAREKKDYER